MDSFTRQKIFLLLLAGIGLGFSYTPQRYWRILKATGKAWNAINGEKLKEEIRKLYRSKLVEKHESSDGTITLVLTERGKMRALTYRFEEMRIRPKGKWDGKWRLVVFDIPEKLRRGRDALRLKLRELGFYEFQKSVFVFPFECEREVEFVVEFFDLRRYVRFGILERIDNELHLKKIFYLL